MYDVTHYLLHHGTPINDATRNLKVGEADSSLDVVLCYLAYYCHIESLVELALRGLF